MSVSPVTPMAPPTIASLSTTIPLGAVIVRASSEFIGPLVKIPPDVSKDKSVMSRISILPPEVIDPPRFIFPSTTASLATPRPPLVVMLAFKLLLAVVQWSRAMSRLPRSMPSRRNRPISSCPKRQTLSRRVGKTSIGQSSPSENGRAGPRYSRSGIWYRSCHCRYHRSLYRSYKTS